MKAFLVMSLITFSFLSSAQIYTCEEIPELKRTLRQLQRECGNTGGNPNSRCKVTINGSSYPGQTMEDAINLCTRASSWSESTCAKNLKCNFRRYCAVTINRQNYLGKTIEGAINFCTKYSSWSESTCIRNLKCHGFRNMCYVKINGVSYPGHSVDDAIALCKRGSSWSESTCARNVHCE